MGLRSALLRDYGRKTCTKEKPFMAPVSTERDLRLDLFRGLALWLIFLDHIPSNAVSWITIRNYGFSDATEIFVFISGYTAAFVYGRAMQAERLRRRRRARAQARLADLCGACVPVRDLSRRDRLCRAQLRQPALYRRDGRARLHEESRRHDPAGAAVEVQTGEHGRAAALYRAAALVRADIVAAAALAFARAAGFGSALFIDVDVRLEFPGLSERHLGVQSVRLAIAVRVRRLVRARRRAKTLRAG